jgi:hypothetical protein
MDCPEKIRLQQLYDAALRRWSQVQKNQVTDGMITPCCHKSLVIVPSVTFRLAE